MGTVPQFENESIARIQPYSLFLFFSITGAKTVVPYGDGVPEATYGFDTPGSATAALGQTTIDELLDSTNEVIAATAFGSTALGTDAFGFVLDCDQQIKSVVSMKVTANIGSGGASVEALTPGQVSALPNTLPALARAQKTSNGNIAGQFVLAGLDAATSGLIVVELLVYIK